MKLIIYILLTFFPVVMFGQQTKKIIDKNNNEAYYVLKSNNKLKHGEYEKFSSHKSVIVKGFYKSGIKDSIWECYDYDGQSILKYNYSKAELVFYKPDESMKKTTYKLICNNNDSNAILSRVPIYLGGDYYILSEVLKNIKFPLKAQEYNKSGTVFVSFTVDKFGKTSNYHVNKTLGYGLDEESIRVLKLIPDNWLPGLQKGKAVDVEVSYPIAYALQE